MTSNQNTGTRLIAIASKTMGGRGVVDIIRQFENGDTIPVWRYQPWNNNPPLVFTQIIHDRLAIAVDGDARISLADIQRQTLSRSVDFEGAPLTGAVLSPDERLLCCVTRNRGWEDYVLICVDTSSLTETKRIQLPAPVLPDRMAFLAKNIVVIYFQAGQNFESRSEDGFLRININTGAIDIVFLRFSPTGLFDPPPVLFSAEHNIGIRPHYETIEIRQAASEKKYIAKLDCFSLTNGHILNTFEVRAFLDKHVFEDTDPRYALSLLNHPNPSDEYLEVRDEFLERITTLVACQNEKSFWVGFHHGLIRKFSYDGEAITPLIAHPQNCLNDPRDPYTGSGFDTPIDADDDSDIIIFGNPPVKLDLTKIPGLFDPNAPIVSLNPEDCSPVTSPEPKVNDPFSWNTVAVDDIQSEPDVLRAMEECVSLARRVTETRDGDFFRVRFTSGNKTLTQLAVFQTATRYPSGIPYVVDYLNALMAFKAPLYSDTGSPAGLDAARALVSIDLNHVTLFNEYLSSGLIEPNERSTELSQTIDDIIQRYGWREKTVDMVLTRAVFQPESGLDQLLAFMSTQAFKTYAGNRQNARYFYQHHLFKSLLEDFFSILLPDENRLFEAIEAEDIEAVTEILKTEPLQINIVHPEIEINPLDLAFSLNNDGLVKLLLKKGAKSAKASINGLNQEGYTTSSKGSDTAETIQYQIDLLKKRQKYVRNKISELEFEEMVHLSIDPLLADQLETLNHHLKGINEQIETLQREKQMLIAGDDPYGSMNSNAATSNIQYDSESSELTLYFQDIESPSEQTDAILNLRSFLSDFQCPKELDHLDIKFTDGHTVLDEDAFFSGLTPSQDLTPALLGLLHEMSNRDKLSIWNSEDAQLELYPLKTLCLWDKQYLSEFVFQLRSGGLDQKHHQPVLSELMIDILIKYDWCPATLELVLTWLLNQEHETVITEIRHLYKKGGLKEYLNDESARQMARDIITDNTDHITPAKKALIQLLLGSEDKQ